MFNQCGFSSLCSRHHGVMIGSLMRGIDEPSACGLNARLLLVSCLKQVKKVRLPVVIQVMFEDSISKI